MSKYLLLLIAISPIFVLFSQNTNTVSPKKAIEIFHSEDYKKVEPVEFNLDSVGTKIIRQLFFDKANYPERISKKLYLDNPYLSSNERRILSNLYKSLEDRENRREVYDLTSDDSLLVYAWSTRTSVGLWSFESIDSTIASNSYYQFFTFSIRMSQNSIPRVVANNFETSGPYGATSAVGKDQALIYDPSFTVGIPKVNLIDRNNNPIVLPLILLGKDFTSYPSSQLLLESVLKKSGYSDSTARSLLVFLDAYADYKPKNFRSVSCQKFNLFKNKECYQFSTRRTEYKATINKSNEISYALVEEPQNLISHLESVFKNRCNKSNPEITFKSKRGRKFIYEIEVYNYMQREYEGYKAVYNRGRIRFREVE